MCYFRTISSSTFITSNSTSNSGLIPGGQIWSSRQTLCFLLVDPMDKEHKDPDTIDLEAPRASCTIHTQNIKETSKHGVLRRHQTCSEERIKVLSNAMERHHFFKKHSQLLVSRQCFGWKTEKSYTKKYMRHLGLLDEGIGFRSCSTTRRRSCSTTKNSQSTQPNPNHDRTVRSVVCSQSECSMLNEVDIDFRIPGLPHSVVKQSQNSRVREKVKKIENHPHRQALEHDLQSNNAYNQFSAKSKNDDSGHV